MRLLAASRRETLRELAVTLLGLSEESLNAVLGSSAFASRDSLSSIPVCRINAVGNEGGSACQHVHGGHGCLNPPMGNAKKAAPPRIPLYNGLSQGDLTTQQRGHTTARART